MNQLYFIKKFEKLNINYTVLDIVSINGKLIENTAQFMECLSRIFNFKSFLNLNQWFDLNNDVTLKELALLFISFKNKVIKDQKIPTNIWNLMMNQINQYPYQYEVINQSMVMKMMRSTTNFGYDEYFHCPCGKIIKKYSTLLKNHKNHYQFNFFRSGQRLGTLQQLALLLPDLSNLDLIYRLNALETIKLQDNVIYSIPTICNYCEKLLRKKNLKKQLKCLADNIFNSVHYDIEVNPEELHEVRLKLSAILPEQEAANYLSAQVTTFITNVLHIHNPYEEACFINLSHIQERLNMYKHFKLIIFKSLKNGFSINLLTDNPYHIHVQNRLFWILQAYGGIKSDTNPSHTDIVISKLRNESIPSYAATAASFYPMSASKLNIMKNFFHYLQHFLMKKEILYLLWIILCY